MSQSKEGTEKLEKIYERGYFGTSCGDLYEYVGQVSYMAGKPLWEILGNLRNNGVGRLVTRGAFLRYQEPTFYKIVKVETHNQPENIHENRRCIAWVEFTLRGHLLPEYIELFKTTYKPDYQLIPKEDEQLWYKRAAQYKIRPKIFYPYIKMPPLLKNLVIEEKMMKGELVTEEPKLRAHLKPHKYHFKFSRLAEEGETPTDFFEEGVGTPLSPQFYENIEAAKEFFVGKDPWEKPVTNWKRGWFD